MKAKPPLKIECNTCNTIMPEVNQMGKTKVTSIRIDEKVFRDAKDLGLNISKVAENALKATTEAIRINTTKGGFSGRAFAQQKGGMVRGKGFEPSNPCGTGSSSLRLRPSSATPARF